MTVEVGNLRFGTLLRELRMHRQLSQLDLALGADRLVEIIPPPSPRS